MKRLWEEEKGEDLVEYALLTILIVLAVVASIRSIGETVSDAFSNASGNLTAAS